MTTRISRLVRVEDRMARLAERRPVVTSVIRDFIVVVGEVGVEPTRRSRGTGS